MKKMTCRELRGACDLEITGNSPEEMGANSKAHIVEMIQSQDKDHIEAIESMRALSPEDQQKWYEDFAKSFDSQQDA